MTKLTLSPPIVKEKVTTAEPKVGTALTAIESFLNGKELDGAQNIKAEGIKESNLEAALQTKIAEKGSVLKLEKQAGSTTAATGNIYLMETNGATLTLPVATAQRAVGIICLNSIASVKLKAPAGVKIYGDFSNGVEELVILTNQHVIVQADGASWHIISGEPKQAALYEGEKTITLAAAEAGVEISPSRPALVTVVIEVTAKKAEGLEITVAGKRVGYFSTASAEGITAIPLTFRVGAAQVWKAAFISAYVSPVRYFAIIL